MDIIEQIKFLTEINIQEIVMYIVEDENIEYDVALDEFYNSVTFSKLSDKETGLYRESSAYVYELYKAENQTGKFPHTDA